MRVPVIAICGIATDAWSWDGMPVDRIMIPRGPSITAMAYTILAELPERFALCGHSMGGYVALQMMRIAAQRVAGLALVSTSAAADTPEQRVGRAAVIEQARSDFAGVVEKLAHSVLSAASRAVPAIHEGTHAMLMRCGSERFSEQQSAAAGRNEATGLLGGISVPTLVVSGEEDRIVAPERSQELAAAIPGAVLVSLPKCGHIPQREAPGPVREALSNWIDTAEAA